MEGGHVARGCGAVVVGNREVVTSAGELVEGGGSGVAGAAGGEQDHTQEELEEAGCHGRWGRGGEAMWRGSVAEVEAAEVAAEGRGDVGSEEAEVDVGFDEVELVADVMALPGEAEAMEGLLTHEGGHGVGELELAPFADGYFFEVIENGGGKDVAGADGEA